MKNPSRRKQVGREPTLEAVKPRVGLEVDGLAEMGLSTEPSRQYVLNQRKLDQEEKRGKDKEINGAEKQAGNRGEDGGGLDKLAIKREIEGALHKQLDSLKNPDGTLYRQIDRKFQEGFSEIRKGIQEANQDILQNLNKIKAETNVAIQQRDLAMRELDQVKRNIDQFGEKRKQAGPDQFKKPFGGVDGEELDEFLRRYGVADEKRTDQTLQTTNYEQSAFKPSKKDSLPILKKTASRETKGFGEGSKVELSRQGSRVEERVDRYSSQPIRYKPGPPRVQARLGENGSGVERGKGMTDERLKAMMYESGVNLDVRGIIIVGRD